MKPASVCARRGRNRLVAEPRQPVSVLVVVYADNADILLLKRRQPLQFWQSVTGSLESGESPIDAARREITEETGLTNEGNFTDAGITRQFTIDPRWRDRYAAGVTENTEHEWHYQLPSAVDVSICDEEHSAFQWFTIEEAIESVWSWTNKEALQNLRAKWR